MKLLAPLSTHFSSSGQLSFTLKAAATICGLSILSACNEPRPTVESDFIDSSARQARIADSGITKAQDTTQAPAVNQQAIDALDDLEFEQFEELYLSSETTYSIWPRVRAGFQIDSSIDHPSLQSELKWLAKHHTYMQRVMRRADPFLYYILEEAEKRDLPTELVLLPVVESAFQPFAYSHGRAAGIWQFIPSTGRIFGLKQNWWYDGRRDIYASTQAALDYLEKLNKQFDGDWLLALAAYNSGSGTVSRAIKRNKKANKPTDFWHLKLPKETGAYVPKLLGLK